MKTRHRKKRSIVWTMPRDKFEALVRSYSTVTAIVKALGLTLTGRGFRLIKQRIQDEGIEVPNLRFGLDTNRGKRFNRPKMPFSEILIDGSTYPRQHLKNRLIDEGILFNVCKECGQESNWFGKPLVLVLDHINGKPDDNRLQNLRLLCPNCNSQQDTFCGRNKKKRAAVALNG